MSTDATRNDFYHFVTMRDVYGLEKRCCMSSATLACDCEGHLARKFAIICDRAQYGRLSNLTDSAYNPAASMNACL